LDEELLKWGAGIVGACILMFISWLAKSVIEQTKALHAFITAHAEEHRLREKRLDELIAALRTDVELHAAFITPLNTVFQQHLASALFKTNPFTAAENEAAAHYRDYGPRRVSDGDLLTLRSGLFRVLGEAGVDIDKLVYASLLAGIGYEWRRRHPLPKMAVPIG
jgi:hypothetical protein